MLPDMDGFEVTRRLREPRPPAADRLPHRARLDDDKIKGLTVGGDDYVTKPFSLEEVVARIRAVLRRTRGEADDGATLRFDDLELDEDSHEVRRGGRVIELSPTEFKLLRYLHAQPEPGPVQGADPRPRLGLRLPRRVRHRRVLHLLPAPQDRHRRACPADPHQARRRLRAAAAPRADQLRRGGTTRPPRRRARLAAALRCAGCAAVPLRVRLARGRARTARGAALAAHQPRRQRSCMRSYLLDRDRRRSCASTAASPRAVDPARARRADRSSPGLHRPTTLRRCRPAALRWPRPPPSRTASRDPDLSPTDPRVVTRRAVHASLVRDGDAASGAPSPAGQRADSATSRRRHPAAARSNRTVDRFLVTRRSSAPSPSSSARARLVCRAPRLPPADAHRGHRRRHRRRRPHPAHPGAATPTTRSPRCRAPSTRCSPASSSRFAVREASEEQMRQFVADASHELRTPLATVRGYAELYRQGAVPDRRRRGRRDGAHRGRGDRMSGLVEDLLTLARLDGERPLELQTGRPRRAGRGRRAGRPRLAPGPAHLAAGLDGPIGPTECTADEHRLRQVVTNLVANALRHTPDGTPVEIARRPPDAGRVALEVRDHGPGIPRRGRDQGVRALLPRRPARAAAARGGGSGLGLAIVAAIVGAHGGAVGVARDPGRRRDVRRRSFHSALPATDQRAPDLDGVDWRQATKAQPDSGSTTTMSEQNLQRRPQWWHHEPRPRGGSHRPWRPRTHDPADPARRGYYTQSAPPASRRRGRPRPASAAGQPRRPRRRKRRASASSPPSRCSPPSSPAVAPYAATQLGDQARRPSTTAARRRRTRASGTLAAPVDAGQRVGARLDRDRRRRLAERRQHQRHDAQGGGAGLGRRHRQRRATSSPTTTSSAAPTATRDHRHPERRPHLRRRRSSAPTRRPTSPSSS